MKKSLLNSPFVPSPDLTKHLSVAENSSFTSDVKLNIEEVYLLFNNFWRKWTTASKKKYSLNKIDKHQQNNDETMGTKEMTRPRNLSG